jgi:hypothetical protein
MCGLLCAAAGVQHFLLDRCGSQLAAAVDARYKAAVCRLAWTALQVGMKAEEALLMVDFMQQATSFT